MGKDLTSMIEEVNGASATLSKTNKADEPVSIALPTDCAVSPLIIPPDLSNRAHPQFSPVATAGYRSRHIRTPNKGQRSPEGWTVSVFPVRLWLQQLRHG